MKIENEIVEKLSSLEKLIANYSFKYRHCKDIFEKNKELINTLGGGTRKFDILHLIVTKQCNKVSDISKLLDLSTSSLSLIISKMVTNGLIEKKYDTTTDSRKVILEVSELGYNNYNLLKKIYCQELTRFINSLKDEELLLFYKAVYSLSSALESFSVKKIEKDSTAEEMSEIIYTNIFILKIPFEKFFRQARNSLSDKLSLTDKETEILMVIKNAKINTPSELSNILGSSESTISIQLKALVNKGYLTKEKSKKDIRKTLFLITELGIDTTTKEFKLIQEKFIEMVSYFNQEDKVNILEGLNSLHIFFELLSSYN